MPEVELESLINAKSGACPEDCAFCSQSARYSTDVDVYPFLDLDEVLAAAHATRDAGATQFCIVVAVRGPEERLLTQGHRRGRRGARARPASRSRARSASSREPQAQRLAAAGREALQPQPRGVPRGVPVDLHDAHLRRPRRRPRSLAIDAGMELCCGGILGMGETLEQRVDFAFELAELEPCEVPINFLDPDRARRSATSALHHAARGAAGDRAVPPRAAERVDPPRRWPRARARRAAGDGPARRRQRADRRQLPHDDRPSAPRRTSRCSTRWACRSPTAPARAASSSTPPAPTPAPRKPARADDPRPRRVALTASRRSRPSRQRRSRAEPAGAEELAARAGQVEVVLADEHPAHEQPDHLLDHHDPRRRQQRVVR